MAEIFDEAARAEELDRYAGLDALGDGAFDDITALVARFFKVPVAIVSLVRGGRVHFKSAHGVENLRRTGADLGQWAAAIMSDKPCIGETDPPFDRPAVNDNGLRFYATAPIHSVHGYRLGALCIIDMVPRRFPRDDAQMLARFARLVMVQMEQRLASRSLADLVQGTALPATLDVRTGLLNRGAITSRLHALCDAAVDNRPVATLLFDVDRLRTVNDIYGQAGGDAVLAEVASRIQMVVRFGDHVGRFGGEEFLVILADCDQRVTASIAERIRQAVERTPIQYGDRNICITISAGAYLASGRVGSETALRAADEALLKAKREGRNRVVFSRPHADPGGRQCLAYQR